jgi:hypothetical protein
VATAALSNPFSTDKGRLTRLIELRDEALTRASREPTPAPIRPRVGEILQTVEAILLDAGKPLPVREIHAGCERVLGRPVVYSTVKDTLRDKRRPKPPFKRVSHGWYELIE